MENRGGSKVVRNGAPAVVSYQQFEHGFESFKAGHQQHTRKESLCSD